MRMWAALRETYGVEYKSRHPIGRLLAAQPDLRGLLPDELAGRLQIALEHAQAGIFVLAAECFPAPVLRAGESFDSLTILAGTYAPAVELEGEGVTMTTRPRAATLRVF